MKIIASILFFCLAAWGDDISNLEYRSIPLQVESTLHRIGRSMARPGSYFYDLMQVPKTVTEDPVRFQQMCQTQFGPHFQYAGLIEDQRSDVLKASILCADSRQRISNRRSPDSRTLREVLHRATIKINNKNKDCNQRSGK